MPPEALRRILLLVLVVVLPTTAIAADLSTGAYRLPLVEPYAIYRPDETLGASEDRGTYQLVRYEPRTQGGGYSLSTLVRRVELVAVHERVMFGKSKDGFFILDAREPDPEPTTFSAREPWQVALRERGVADPDVLKTPDALASGLPDEVLRPWDYRVMGGRFGISDDVWSLIVQLLGFVIAFVVGLACAPRKSPMVAAVVLGLIVNVVAQILIAGGGPGAFVGFVALPLICMLAAALGKGIRAITTGGHPTGA
jgi:hypothetical protein